MAFTNKLTSPKYILTAKNQLSNYQTEILRRAEALIRTYHTLLQYKEAMEAVFVLVHAINTGIPLLKCFSAELILGSAGYFTDKEFLLYIN